MKILTQTLLLAVAAGLAPCVASADAQDFDVLKVMSVTDFRASGLDKLSDAQLKALNAWFQNYQREHGCPPATAGTAPATPSTAPTPKAAAPSLPEETYPLVAHLAGKFKGWSGATDFTLDNGQVWEQVDDSSFSTSTLTNPKITITRGLMGSYYLSVEGVRETVLVKRIKH